MARSQELLIPTSHTMPFTGQPLSSVVFQRPLLTDANCDLERPEKNLPAGLLHSIFLAETRPATVSSR